MIAAVLTVVILAVVSAVAGAAWSRGGKSDRQES